MHNSRFLTLSCAAILATAVLVPACSDPEAEARKLFNQGMTLQREGQAEEALAGYKRVVELYPQTQTAVEANKLLLQATSAQSVMDTMTGGSRESRMDEILKRTAQDALEWYDSQNGRYPTTEEGLEALINYMSPEDLSKLISRFEYKGPSESNPLELTIRNQIALDEKRETVHFSPSRGLLLIALREALAQLRFAHLALNSTSPDLAISTSKPDLRSQLEELAPVGVEGIKYGF